MTRKRKSGNPAGRERPTTNQRLIRSGNHDLERIAERVLKLSEADQTEVEIGAATDALTRFANNTIHQNVAEQTLGISVRAVVDGRTARASTNKTDDDSLRRAAATAVSLARNEPRNPDLLPMLRAQKYQKVARFFAATAETDPQDRARAVKRVCEMADRNKQTAAGIFSSGRMQSVLANSRGLFG
ncbi:MAG TPA: DNA gyrase modulator, partial [Candidatus Acidoferrales bacterium]|nr:DNA gyrase modulator [Candidatus Acidoferrales bacterium]